MRSSIRFFATWDGLEGHKAGAGEKVRGIIITRGPDERIKYAIYAADGTAFFTYKVSFDLVARGKAG